jgi:GNAT superfamily N-acetyltransferase
VSADPRLELAEAAAYGSFNDAAALPVLRVAGATCYATPALSGNTMLNRAVGLGVDGPVTDAVLDEIDAFFREAGVRYGVSLAPQAPPELAAGLRERGFTDGYAWMKFRRGTDHPPVVETSLRIEQATGDADVAGVLAGAYGLPISAGAAFDRLGGSGDWHVLLAHDGTVPVGAGALFVHQGVGWLGAAGTLPEHRGKGAQSALLAARIALAHELGLDAVTTETGERVADRPAGSYRNILRAGFEEAYLRPNLLSPAAAG